MYQTQPQLASCIYPDVEIKNIPVGEYENADDMDILQLRGITMSNRMKYTWGDVKVITASINRAKDYDIDVHKLPSGQVSIIATKNK
ncbi:hypothetical protein H0A36_30065 [Endozoicomonas sp. SM1973]|uniref:Uncharacterized protein n=1 Tax=Spartinivicinus marinus TaxID=2994442 RepID=A0A853IJI2_9GAMM|nr:hypothetical protein [Spartinivicinus marinus]MCX4030129.1 hypothetical protein [Spartinivicinus marinus]NYZ70261.1 hypothetical protein [Spartinivicinus marinus]